MTSKFDQSRSNLKEGSKKRGVYIDPSVAEFLRIILKPLDINHNASQADMIKNLVLSEIRQKVERAIETQNY